jgi:hypothetical protein
MGGKTGGIDGQREAGKQALVAFAALRPIAQPFARHAIGAPQCGQIRISLIMLLGPGGLRRAWMFM